MNSYEARYDSIIKEHDLTRNDFIDSTKIHNIILELFQKKCLKKKIALWGAGYNNSMTSHAAVLLTKYATCLQGVVCLIDSCKELQGKDLLGYPIIAPEQLKDWDIDLVIISSRSSAESIKQSLHQFGPDCASLDLYQELRDQGIDIHYNFYEERSFYSELYDVRVAYENAKEEEKAALLWKLIASYLKIKDFYYAFVYMDRYIEKQYDRYEEIRQTKEQIQELILEVQKKNEKRKGDITIHYIDALRAVDVLGEKKDTYQVLNEYLKDSVVFTDIHSTAPTTYESMYATITEHMPYTENVYEDRFILGLDECDLLKKAYEKGYSIRLYSSAEWRIFKEDERIHYVDQIHLTDKLWTMACEMAETKEATFNYAYYPWELHFPLLCGYHTKEPVAVGFKDVGIKDMSGFIEGQLQDCLHYVDQEFAFYAKILPQNGYTVLFSDHSQIVYDPEKCVPFYCYAADNDRSTHCIMAIKGPGIVHKEDDSLQSLLDFNKLVEHYVWNEGKVPENEMIHYQYYSTHNKQFRDVAKQKGLEDYIDGIQGFRSKEYVYCVTKTGKEEVYRIGDLKYNLIQTKEGKRFAEKVKSQYDISFPKFLEMHY